MAAPKTGHDLLGLVAKSQLLSRDLLEKLQPQVSKYLNDDSQRLAKLLIKNGLVTEYQARHLLAGKYRGFYVGKYKLLELIGKGGMGKVFLAEQLTMERLIALKVVGNISRKSREKEVLARFRREAKAVAALNHPNIVHAYDFDEEAGTPYIVMEYVEGLDVATLVGKQGPLSPAHACDIILQAAAGLQHAHKAGMVHRDIKPGNLLIDAAGVVRILDLGLCSCLESGSGDSLTVDQDQLGTVDYIAPEQSLNSHQVDARADLYSLGVTFYCMLTGNVLFPGYTTTQKLIAHQTEEPKNICDLVPAVPPELGAIIHKMLAKKPENRTQSAVEVQQELQRFAKRPTPPYDLKLIRNQRARFEAFIGKAPEPSEITAGEMVGKIDSDETGGASQPSQSTIGSGLSMVSADPFGGESFMDDQAMTMLELPSVRPKKKKKKQESKKDESAYKRAIIYLGVGCGLAGIILLSTLFINTTLLAVSEPVTLDVPTVPGQSTAEYMPARLGSVATAISTKSMFTGLDGDTMVFSDWGPKTFQGVPFELVNPQGQQQRNVILLYSDQGVLPPQMPTSVKLSCNRPLVAIHLLSGVCGWGHPINPVHTEVLKVRLHLANGQVEDHSFINGEHFADYIRRVDVSGSEFAFDLSGKQIRYLQVRPRSKEVVRDVEFVKGENVGTAPVVMAVTYELAK